MDSPATPEFAFGNELVEHLRATMPRSELTHLRHEEARRSQVEEWPEWLAEPLVTALRERGIDRPYRHQVATATAAWSGRDVIVATGTASGKSLGYQLPILQDLSVTHPTASALYLAPTKALSQDQRLALASLCDEAAGPDFRPPMVATYDGDTPSAARRAIRDEARIIITNPDMLHASVLANPGRWGRLLRTLRYIVIDEAHVYRGVFGAHVALVLRRLLRLCATPPRIILASATSTDPAGHAERLTGRRGVLAVSEDGSPRGTRSVALWQPGFLPPEEETGVASVRRAATSEAAEVMGRLIGQGARSLSFVGSRKGAEIVAMGAAATLAGMGRADEARRVAAYRAGYTPEQRRRIERQLDEGELLGVASTSALELGIDVGGLDAVVSCGFPGTIASFRQQAGRAGRRGQGALVVFVASDNPLDQYLIHHPADLLDRPVEASVFDPTNPYVLAAHVLCAAAEKPLSDADIAAWDAAGVVAALERSGELRRRPAGMVAELAVARSIHGMVSLRGGSGHDRVQIVDADSGEVLGDVDRARAASDVHAGAVYLHQGVSYVVERAEWEGPGGAVSWVRQKDVDYTTTVLRETSIEVLGTQRTQRLAPGVWLADVTVEVQHHIHGYRVQRRGGDGGGGEAGGGEIVPLDVEPESLRTRAVAYTIDPEILSGELGLIEPLWPGALHAAEHAAIGLLPLVATCDRWDIGGVSTACHAATGLPTVFVYDGYPGGAGFAERGFDRFARWMRATADTVEGCPCVAGCPSCVQSPKCGNGNEPLFKAGALEVLRLLAECAEE